MTRPTQPPMTDERLDRVVRQLLVEIADDIAAGAGSSEVMADRVASSLRQRRSGQAWAVLAAAAMLTALLIGGALTAGSAFRLSAVPSPEPGRPEWTGPLRPDMATLPSILMPEAESDMWFDPQDVETELIDIGEIRYGGGPARRWDLMLRGPYPRAATLDEAAPVIAYGLVLDGDADGVGDCLVGLSNDTPRQGEYRAWVTNLTTGKTDEQIGPPYGHPIDFVHPAEQDADSRWVRLFFLAGTRPCDLPGSPARFYAWASETRAGQVVAWDYAPDAAWLDPWGSRP